jgi:hypothetical protein
MTSEERARRVRNYFTIPPKPPIKDYVKAAVGLILILTGAHVAFLLVVGLAILVWGGVGIARYAYKVTTTRPKATGAEMDAWLEEALIPTAQTGAKRLNVHPTELVGSMEDSRLIFVGFPNIENVRIARGDDKKMRYSHYEILVVFLSNWRLPVYEVNYDMVNGFTVLENTKEYNLGQVDGIETSSDRVNVLSVESGNTKDGKQATQASTGAIGHVTNAQILSLMVSGNRAVTLITGVADSESVRIENVDDPSRIDNGISRLREHLRVRHQGAYPAGAGLPGGGGPASLGAPPDLGLDLPSQRTSQPNALRQGPDWPTPGYRT